MMRKGPGPMFTAAWGVLAVVATSLILVGGFILYAPGDATWFTGLTGQEFESLETSSPELAGYVNLITRLLAVATMGFGILALFVTWFGVRDRSPLSINVMWTLPLLTVALALTFVLDGNSYLGLGLGALTVVLALALLVARRTS